MAGHFILHNGGATRYSSPQVYLAWIDKLPLGGENSFTGRPIAGAAANRFSPKLFWKTPPIPSSSSIAATRATDERTNATFLTLA